MNSPSHVSTTNACKLCTPLGAALFFKGIEGGVPFLHGSQGCATYMRRYVISHYREPIDIASSSLGEKQAIYGGGPNLKKGLLNVMKKYEPKFIGVATTCLTETIGDDPRMILAEFKREFADLDLPAIVSASTPSFSGSHADGWTAAAAAVVDQLAGPGQGSDGNRVNILPNLLSCLDYRRIKQICLDFGLDPLLLPDISETLDGPILDRYLSIASGGSPLERITTMGGAAATLEFGTGLPRDSGGAILESKFKVPNKRILPPIGIRATDGFFEILGKVASRPVPAHYLKERGRLVDAYVDGHKYLFGKRAVVYGEEHLVSGLVSFLAETGVEVVLAATGGKGTGLAKAATEACTSLSRPAPVVLTGADFSDIADQARDLAPDLMVGNSKGYRYAREWSVPLVRVGFPIHDRFGAQRIGVAGYAGTQELYDRLVTAVQEKQQADSPVGFSYQ